MRLATGHACAFALFLASALNSQATADPSRAITMEDVFELRELGGLLQANLSPSPSGEQIALFEREADRNTNLYRHYLIVVDVLTGSMRRLSDAGDVILLSRAGRRSGAPLDRRPIWSPDERFIYYLAERKGEVQIWRSAVDGSVEEEELVVAPSGDVRRFALTSDGRALIFEQISSRDALRLQREREDRDGFWVDEQFTPLYALRPLPDEESGARISWFSLVTGETRPARESERMVLETSSRSDFIRPRASTNVHRPPLELYTQHEDQEVVCAASPCDGALKDAWALGDGETRRILFRRLEGHAGAHTALYAWSPGSGLVRAIRQAPDRLEGCVVAGIALLCLQDYSTQPRRLVRIDPDNGALRVLYDPNPSWSSLHLPRVERLDFTDDEGNQSFAQVVFPVGYQPGRAYPLAIVQYRARGFLNAGTGGEAPIFPLAAQGLFVLAVDRPEFDIRSAQLTLNELTRQTELDGSETRIKRAAILYFIAQLEQRGLIDVERLGITGMSDGAETAFSMLLNAPIFRAAVVASPPPDPIAYELLSARTRAQRRAQLGLSPPWAEDGDFYQWWRDNSVSLRGAPIYAALMMNLAESEALRAFPMLARLERTTTPTETYLYPGAYHLKWRPAQIWASQTRTLNWLRFWLLDRDPADSAQAARWRAMRDRAAGQLGASPQSAAESPSP